MGVTKVDFDIYKACHEGVKNVTARLHKTGVVDVLKGYTDDDPQSGSALPMSDWIAFKAAADTGGATWTAAAEAFAGATAWAALSSADRTAVRDTVRL